MQFVKLTATDGHDVNAPACVLVPHKAPEKEVRKPAVKGTLQLRWPNWWRQRGGSDSMKVIRGFKSAVVSNDLDPLNAVGLGYMNRKEGLTSVVNYDAVKGDANTRPASSS